MSAQSPDPVILDYIRANRASFSREEIERELLISGHQPEEIARTWAAIEAEDSPALLAPIPLEVGTGPSVPLGDLAPTAGRDPAIDRYIRENRNIYTRPAITASLVESGHAPVDIEAAWAEIAAVEAPLPVPPSVSDGRRAVLNSWRFWVTASVTLVALLVLPTVLTVAVPDQPIGPIVGCALLIGPVAAGLILLAIGKARDVAYGLLAGVGALFALSVVLTLLGFILVFVVVGVCLVVISQSGSTP